MHLGVFLGECSGGAVKLRLELEHLLLARSLAALRLVARLFRALQLPAQLLQHARVRVARDLAQGAFFSFAKRLPSWPPSPEIRTARAQEAFFGFMAGGRKECLRLCRTLF